MVYVLIHKSKVLRFLRKLSNREESFFIFVKGNKGWWDNNIQLFYINTILYLFLLLIFQLIYYSCFLFYLWNLLFCITRYFKVKKNARYLIIYYDLRTMDSLWLGTFSELLSTGFTYNDKRINIYLYLKAIFIYNYILLILSVLFVLYNCTISCFGDNRVPIHIIVFTLRHYSDACGKVNSRFSLPFTIKQIHMLYNIPFTMCVRSLLT